MLDLTLPKSGNAYSVIQFFQTKGEADPILIDGCARCLGIIFLLKRKEKYNKDWLPLYAIRAWHVPPYERAPKEYFCWTLEDMEYYELQEIHFCGGKIDCEENKIHRQRSIRKFISPFQRLFPQSKIYSYNPEATTAYSSIYLDEELNIYVDLYC